MLNMGFKDDLDFILDETISTKTNTFIFCDHYATRSNED